MGALAALTKALPDGIVDAHHHVWDLPVRHTPTVRRRAFWPLETHAGLGAITGGQMHMERPMMRPVDPMPDCILATDDPPSDCICAATRIVAQGLRSLARDGGAAMKHRQQAQAEGGR